MKKIVLSILLVLVFSCPIFALDLSINEAEIVEMGDSYAFSLSVSSHDLEEIFMFILDDSAISYWAYLGDNFISNVNYAFLPVSYTTNKENITGDAVYDTPILLYQDTSENPLIKYYGLLDYHQVDFLTALLNDGFVLLEIHNLSTQEAKSYYLNISNNTEREEALKKFNRYMNYFY